MIYLCKYMPNFNNHTIFMPKNFLRFYWKTILFCILIFVLSSVTFKSLPDAAKFQNSDKLTHAIMYVVLGLIVFFEFQKDTFFKAKYKYWLAGIFLFLVIFGGFIYLCKMILCRNNFIIQMEEWIFQNLSEVRKPVRKTRKTK